MSDLDFASIRQSLREMGSDHDAAGVHQPNPSEVFAPVQHANALDPRTSVVVGARGAGKSFWAGVLEQDDTRAVATQAYPHLGLERILVKACYTGLDGNNVVTPKALEARVPEGEEGTKGPEVWHAAILRAAKSVVSPQTTYTIKEIIEQYSDPEDFDAEMRRIDDELISRKKVLLVTFDALDTLSRSWQRSAVLTDALFEVVWSLRARKAIRAKVFIRPEQLYDESLRFIEMPKLRSSAVNLEWSQVELYGLLFWRMWGAAAEGSQKDNVTLLSRLAGAPIPQKVDLYSRRWRLLKDPEAQERAITILAGPHMGRSNKKGGTYNWPYKHLADAKGKVTPRSFVKLFSEAAAVEPTNASVALSAEGIRQGLRAASKVRVDQIGIEYPWIKRALAPLAGLVVPCDIDEILGRWSSTNTLRLIIKASGDPVSGFSLPFPARTVRDQGALLAEAMERIGVFAYRADGRVDIPDLFRVAALMLKKGGITPLPR